jgi:EamA domain-containing membrane protein RarD
MALFIASLFNYFINPSPEYTAEYSIEEENTIDFLRQYIIPITHGALMIMCFITSSERIPWEGLKQGLNFLGMLLYIEMILQCSLAMVLFKTPIEAGSL